ncbi:hypothetical protein ACHAWF_004167 [Thalassiosira exigua]
MASTAASRAVRRAWRRAAPKITSKTSPSAMLSLRNELDQIITGAPDAAFAVPESVRADAHPLRRKDGSSSNPYADRDDPKQPRNPGAVVRKIGTSRRVLVLDPSLTPEEIDGLAYRVRTLASSDNINSVVVANPMEGAECHGDMSENSTCLPSFLGEGETNSASLNRTGGPYGRKPMNEVKAIMHERFGEGLSVPYVSRGYDARKIYEDGMHRDPLRLERELMMPLMSLSEAVKGSYDESLMSSFSKVPSIALPHGLVTDAGYALLTGSYVLATHSTAFRMVNPLRGLALDPVGLSYFLPRVGYEFNQPCKNHSWAVACILALTGYEANAEDMVATGLATHYVGSPHALNILERTLADLDSYQYQGLYAPPKKLHGRENEKLYDRNDEFRNVQVAELVQTLSEYDAAGRGEYGSTAEEMLDDETGLYLKDADPTVVAPEERNQVYAEHVSELVNWAATFEEAFGEPSVEGILERLREIAAEKSNFEGRAGYEEDVLVAEQAAKFAKDMERRSPLALRATHELLVRGADRDETMETCLRREGAVQTRLFGREDFGRWAESGAEVGLVEVECGTSLTSTIRRREDVFSGWSHGSVREVSDGEVEEILYVPEDVGARRS